MVTKKKLPIGIGKSLNMDMLKTFFEIDTDPSLFDGLEISKDTAFCKQHLGKYPVISISLKDVEGDDFQTAYDTLGILVSEEAGRFSFLFESDKKIPAEKKKMKRLIERDFEKSAYERVNPLKSKRENLWKKHKRAKSDEEKQSIENEIVEISKQITPFTEEIKHCNNIKQRMDKIKQYQEQQKLQEEKAQFEKDQEKNKKDRNKAR